MLEPEKSEEKGGLTVAECRSLLVTEKYKSVRAKGDDAPLDRTWASQWELDGEVANWRVEWGKDDLLIPTAEAVFAAIFERFDPIEWNRFSAFQDTTVRLVAQHMLPKGYPPVYVQGEITQQTILLAPLAAGRTHHLYCSPHNHGAAALGTELQGILPGLAVTHDVARLGECE